MKGVTFVEHTKLPNVKGRIKYISSKAQQENLYAVYETAPQQYWTELAKENQADFKRSGTAGTCIEAREFIIALPKEFIHFDHDELLKYFTESFKRKYGAECIAALHHNKAMTNYHIHLIFSERKILDQKEVKTASRNMFYDERSRHVRTRKEILDEEGKVRPGCRIIPKGEVYEMSYFAGKEDIFKRHSFLAEVKEMYTDLINSLTTDEKERLTVFDPSGPYLPTKKIGKE